MSTLKGDLANTYEKNPSNTKPVVSNKTPYELRFDLLCLAHEIAQKEADAYFQSMHILSEGEKKLSKKDLKDRPDMSADVVMNIAKKLNDFVSNG